MIHSYWITQRALARLVEVMEEFTRAWSDAIKQFTDAIQALYRAIRPFLNKRFWVPEPLPRFWVPAPRI